MSTQKINPRIAVLLIIMIVVAAMRIPSAAQLMPWANFSPVGAMGLFGGAYFANKWKAFLFPLLTLFVSDLIISNFVLHGKYGVIYSGWYIIYGIFILVVLIGKWLLQKVSVVNVILASVVAALSHWLIADFSVWMSGGTDLRTMTPLTKDWAGLIQCYAQGFPFMQKFLLGNLVYSTIMFGSFSLAQQRFPVLKFQLS